MSSNTDTPPPKFDHIQLEEESDGSVADIEDDQVEDTKTKKRKLTKKKKIYFRSDFTGEHESLSSSDEDENNKNSRHQNTGICAQNPVSVSIFYLLICLSVLSSLIIR